MATRPSNSPVTGEEILPVAVELAKAGQDSRAAVTAKLRAVFGERDAAGIEVDYAGDARQVLFVLLPQSSQSSTYGGRRVGYPLGLERAVAKALTTSVHENGNEINSDLLVEATELMDYDADVERLVQEAKPTPSVAMVAAMVARWQLHAITEAKKPSRTRS